MLDEVAFMVILSYRLCNGSLSLPIYNMGTNQVQFKDIFSSRKYTLYFFRVGGDREDAEHTPRRRRIIHRTGGCHVTYLAIEREPKKSSPSALVEAGV